MENGDTLHPCFDPAAGVGVAVCFESHPILLQIVCVYVYEDSNANGSFDHGEQIGFGVCLD